MNLKKGSVVFMSPESGLKGYGNPQCVSHVCEPLGEIGLYGHNQHYKIHHVLKIVDDKESEKTKPLVTRSSMLSMQVCVS